MTSMHPFSGDLSKLSDDELYKAINNLYDRLKKAAYLSHDARTTEQLQFLLADYQEEKARRYRVEQEKFAEKNKKLTEVIDIK